MNAADSHSDNPAATDGLAEAREKIARGQLGDAAAILSKALVSCPNDPTVLHTLGLVACAQGDMIGGADYFRQAIAARPDDAQAYANLGLALAQSGQLDDAVTNYRQSLALSPGVAATLINLGRALVRLSRQDDAIATFEQALTADPASADALLGLGSAYFDKSEYAKSAQSFSDALRLQPHSWIALDGLGNALLQQGDIEGGIQQYRQALALRPDSIATLIALAAASFASGCLADAIACCETALVCDPTVEAAAVNRAIYQRYACDWADFEAHQQMMRDHVRRGTMLVPPFAFLHVASTAAEQLQCARQVAEGPAMPRTAMHALPARAPRAKIRLGYLSSDYRDHATAYLTAELFERHDRSRFDVVGYAIGADDGSAIRQRLVDGFDDFVDLHRMSSAAAAQRIRDDGIDVLIDLNGYAQNGRPQIVALRPAPVQVNYLGYPGTMGTRHIDYVIVDPVVVPLDQQPFFTEKLVHLPDCYQVNDSRRVIADATPSRAECGLPETGFVFCCFNNPSKITPVLFDLWTRLLRTVPGSVLWLLESNPLMVSHLRREAASRGVASERLVFAPPLPAAEHLARHRRADLLLDTLPYGAHTTMSDALWTGLPAVTCLGNSFAGRVGGSLLRTIGMPDLVTGSLADYEFLALRLASQPPELAAIRDRLRRNRTTAPLFDTVRFTRHIEAAYARMYDIWRGGGEPESFAVTPDISA